MSRSQWLAPACLPICLPACLPTCLPAEFGCANVRTTEQLDPPAMRETNAADAAVPSTSSAKNVFGATACLWMSERTRQRLGPRLGPLVKLLLISKSIFLRACESSLLIGEPEIGSMLRRGSMPKEECVKLSIRKKKSVNR